MDTRSISELKKIISEALENDRKEREHQMQLLQEQVNELVNSQKSRNEEDDNSGGSGGANYRGDKEKTNRQIHDIKVDIPEYDGKLDPDEFVEWLHTVERMFDYKDTTDEHKVKIVALKLRKYASTWWSNVCLKRERKGKEKIRSWLKMKEKLKKKFLPSYYLQASFSQLHSLKQGSGTVEEYSRNFEYLLMKCDVTEDDPQTLVRYLGGLEPRVANVVELQPYQTLADLTLLAHKVDTQQRTKGKPEVGPSFKPIQQIKPTSTFKPTHPSNTQEFSNNNQYTDSPRAPRKCFRCQGLGHIASECPNKRIITLADFEIANNSDFAVDLMPTPTPTIEEEEELVGPDEGECLVVRRTLSTNCVQEKELQRESIFYTRCTISQKVCSVLIDGGSCTNVVSQTLVTKLYLPTQPHPSPYVIKWLNQGKGIRVSQRVLLAFSIGRSYRDELWCDVVPMDACHVLLGRPWQFDRRVFHDGYLNTYSFLHNNKKITLTAIIPTTPPTTPTPNLTTLLQAEQHEYHSAKELVLLDLEDEEQKPQPMLHTLIQPLLTAYTQGFSPEIPSGLPPKRSTQHKIDLTPGASLPNKPAYLSNPHESGETRKQVDQLMEKGLMRESLSLCAVPTLLVTKKNGEWRMRIDNRSINKLTIKYHFPLPKLNGLLHEISGSVVFIKIDSVPVDDETIPPIRDWSVPQSIQQVRSFHGLASFYWRCVAATSNVADLQPYFDYPQPIPSLRTNFSEDGEDDRKAPTIDPTLPNPNQKWVNLVQLQA